jgi:hypothetical protein
MYSYKDCQPEKMCIYKGVFRSGNIRYFMQMVKGILTTIDLEYSRDGELVNFLMPLEDPLFWGKITREEFNEKCIEWNKKFKDFEHDFSEVFINPPLYIKELDKRYIQEIEAFLYTS